MTVRKQLIADAVRVLEQGRALLARIPAPLYAKAEASVASSGIGSHFRHLIDYFDLFLEGCPAGKVDYDRRRRDPFVESEPLRAGERLAAAIAALRALEHGPRRDETVLVKADAGCEREDEAPWTKSSVEREIQFLCSHAVHHYALIGVILRLNGEEPPEDFGVAPSTLRYWRESRSCAR